MRRLRHFWGGLPVSAKLQCAALLFVLGYMFVSNDLNPRHQFMGLKLWQFTVPMICLEILLGRLLLPLMMWNTRRTEVVLRGFGILVFAFWIFVATQKPQILLTYLVLVAGMWLDASCQYWFASEIFMRAATQPDEWGDTSTENQGNEESEE